MLHPESWGRLSCTAPHFTLPCMCSRDGTPRALSRSGHVERRKRTEWSTSMTASPVAKAKPLITITHSQSRLLVSRKHSHNHNNLPTENFDLWGIPQTPLSIVDVPRKCCTRLQSPRGPSCGTGQSCIQYTYYYSPTGRDIEALICTVRSRRCLLLLQPPTILRWIACEILRPVHDYSL
jgi:hypothetical protein